MSKKKQNTNILKKTDLSKSLDIVSLLLALAFIQGVLTDFHHAFHAYADDNDTDISSTTGIVLAVLIIFALVMYSCGIRRKAALSKVNIVTFTIVVTSLVFWISGLRANFG